jgi:hypothetical protein
LRAIVPRHLHRFLAQAGCGLDKVHIINESNTATLRGYTYHLTPGTLDPQHLSASRHHQKLRKILLSIVKQNTDALYLLPVCQSNKKFEATTLYPLRQASARTSPLPWTIWRPCTKHKPDRIAGMKATKSIVQAFVAKM